VAEPRRGAGTALASVRPHTGKPKRRHAAALQSAPPLALFCAVVLLLTAPAPGADAPRTGSFTIESPEIDKLIFADVARRWGTTADADNPPKGAEGDAGEKVSWFVYVPAGYRADGSFGLLVWISPTSHAGMPGQWRGVMDRRRLIWIGPNQAGNPVWSLRRHSLAVEAVNQVRLRNYALDPNRIYVSGMSGGGRIASHVALIHADRFTGGFYIVGCNFYQNIMIAPQRYWPGFWPRPDRTLLAKAKKESRFVLLTGETDFNRDQTKKVAEAYEKDGFRYATYVEVPRMAHEIPPAEWFEKGIEALDKPIPEIVAARAPKAGPNPASATGPAPRPAPATRPAADQATSRLRLARLYLANGLKDKAREVLEALVREYPDTPQAAEAGKLLEEFKE